MTDATSFVEPAYNVVAMIGIVVIIYVMQKVETDRIGKIDPYFVQQLRRLGFTGTALALCYSVISTDWNRSLPVLLLVSAGVVNMAINAISLHMRSPPSSGSLMRAHSYRRPYFISRLINYFSMHR